MTIENEIAGWVDSVSAPEQKRKLREALTAIAAETARRCAEICDGYQDTGATCAKAIRKEFGLDE